MANITHGSSLPDSANKSDFYAIIDNATISGITGADMSASANIPDTALAQITTAGKVNTSAITGQIANDNLAQIAQAGKVTGAALTLLANIPAIAGIIPAANLPAIGASIINYAGSFSSGTQLGTAGGTLKIVFGQTGTGVAGGGTQTVTGLPFTSSTSYVVVIGPYTSFPMTLSGKSASQFTLTNTHNDAVGGNGNGDWLAIGV